MPQPNILLLIADQMRGDCLSLEEHPALLTPNLDRLGAAGAHFRRAYTTCPSCIPARRSLLTGQFPATNGMVGFRGGDPLRSKAMPQYFADAGYQTALVGRHMHQDPYEEPYGYQQVTLGSTYVTDDDYARFLDRHKPELGGIRGVGVGCNGWVARPWPYEEWLHPTNWTVRQARRTVADHDGEKPLFLTTSFYAPHPPLIPPPDYYRRYRDMDLGSPWIGDWAATPPPDHGRAHGPDSPRTVLEGEALRSAQAGYYGLINHLDDQLYWLIEEFKGTSVAQGRPWVIVFTSDHGELLGDHYYFRKCEPYEGSARIPLLIHCSNREFGFQDGIVYDQPVCLEDLLPTFLELIGEAIPDRIDGKSLVPILRGERERLRPFLHGEHAPCYSQEQAFHMLTDGRWKYIWRPAEGSEQLFDLQKDPHELVDLAKERNHEANGELELWRHRLVHHLEARDEGFVSEQQQLVAGRPYEAILPAD